MRRKPAALRHVLPLLGLLVGCDRDIPVLDRDAPELDGGTDAPLAITCENIASFPAGTPCDLPALSCIGCGGCGYDCYFGEVTFLCSDCDAGPGDVGADAGTDWLEARANAESFCDYLFRCGPANASLLYYGGRDHCIRTFTDRRLDEIRRGRRVADRAACEAATDFDCDGLPDDLDAVCELAPGPLSEGDVCDDDFECGLSGDGRRMYCTGCGGMCRAYGRVGDPCPAARCDEGHGVFCMPDGAGMTCQALPVVADGEDCTAASCGPASGCDGSVCVRRPRAGEPCVEGSLVRCLGSLDLICLDADGTGARCVVLPTPVPAGNSCTAGTLCAGGGGSPCPASGRCPANCAEGALCSFGEWCDTDATECAADLTCP